VAKEHPLGWPGDWTLNQPADAVAIADCERQIGMTLPADLRAFLQLSDGGEAWFGSSIDDAKAEPSFFIKLMSLADIVGNFALTSKFRGDTLIPFASDGSREYFYLDRDGGPIVMIDLTSPNEVGAPCGCSVSGLIQKLADGWDPFVGLPG
jgi:hypothetical protein